MIRSDERITSFTAAQALAEPAAIAVSPFHFPHFPNSSKACLKGHDDRIGNLWFGVLEKPGKMQSLDTY